MKSFDSWFYKWSLSDNCVDFTLGLITNRFENGVMVVMM